MIEDLLYIAIRGVGLGALFSLVAMSFNIVHRSSHILNFAQGNLLVLGGLGAFLLYHGENGPWMWAAYLLLTAFVIAIVLLVQGYVTLLPLRYSVEQDSWLITTMAASVMIGAVLLLTQGPFVRTAPSAFPAIRLFGMRTPTPYFLCMGLAVFWWLALRWYLANTLQGLAISALSQDYDAARAAGLRVRRLQLIAFAISGLIIGSAGFVAAPIMTITPDSGLRYVINGFIAAVVGGLGNNTGALIGGPIVGLISMFAAYQIGGEFESTILTVVLVGVLTLVPQGLFGHARARRV